MNNIPNSNSRLKDIKIIVVGSCGAGKTAFSQRWVKNEFSEIYKATIMTEFSHKIYEYQGNYYKIQLWDLAGQDKNIYASKVLTKDAHGCLILADMTKDSALQETIKWKKAIDEFKFIDGDNLPCIFIHNKIDLVEKDDYPSDNTIKNIVNKNEFLNYFQTSVKTGINVNESMSFLLDHIIERLLDYAKQSNTPLTKERTSFVLANPKEKEALMRLDEKSGCC